MVKMFRKKFFARAQILSKNFKPLWSLHWKKGTIINPSSKSKALGDIGHSMSMILDTRITIFGVNSGYNFIFDSLWHLITKHAEFFYKIQQKIVIKCVRFFIRKCHTLHKKCSYSELFWSKCGKIRTRIAPNMDTFHAVTVNAKLLQNVMVLLQNAAVVWKWSVKKVLLEISQENTCTSDFCEFCQWNFSEFPFEFCEISKSPFFYRTPPVAASVNHAAFIKNASVQSLLKSNFIWKGGLSTQVVTWLQTSFQAHRICRNQ